MGIQTDSRSPNLSLINTVPVQPQLPTALKSSLIDLLTRFMMTNTECVTYYSTILMFMNDCDP